MGIILNSKKFIQHTIGRCIVTWLLPRCMECRRSLAMRILSVRLSVCQTRALWQNGKKICPNSLQIFILYEKSF